MKTYIKSMMLLVVLSFASCKDQLDINTSPNNPSQSTPQLTLPAGQVALALNLEADYNLLGSFWVQYWTQGPTASQYSFLETYNITTSNYTRTWSSMYATCLEDLEFVRKESIEKGLPNYEAIAEILQVYSFQVLVDLYDKVPYFEALKGKEGSLTPKFDDGEVIYDDLIVRLDAALARMDYNATAVAPTSDDLIYSGDMRQWQKFANTLKFRIYMRQSEARPAVAEAGIKGMVAAGDEFLSAGDDAIINFSNNTANENPFWQNLNLTTFQNIVASETSIDVLQDVNDTRLDQYYDAASNSDFFVGLKQGTGTNSGDQYGDFATPHAGNVLSPTKPAILMSAIESLFDQAEAIERGWITGSAKSFYDQAVLASFEAVGKNGAAFIGAGGPYEYDNTLESIYHQRWLAFNTTQGFEAWSHYRRTNYPVLENSVTGTLPIGEFPARLVWPSNETASNPNSPTTLKTSVPVWWDK